MILPLLWMEIVSNENSTMKKETRKLNKFIFFQRLYSLPERLANRFNMYLNILPFVQTAIIYLFFGFGILFILLSIYKYTKPLRSKQTQNNLWLDDEEDGKEINHNLESRLTSYIPKKRASMSSKELEVYFNSLVTPLNQDLSYRDLQMLKDEDSSK